MVKVNFSEVEDKGFEPLPAGNYTVTISDGEMKETSGKGKSPAGLQMIKWEFTVTDGNFEGRKLFSNTMCEGPGLFSLKQLLAATGKFDVEGDLDFEIEDVIGQSVIAQVDLGEYDGNPTNNIKKYKRAGTEQTGETSLLP